MTETRGFRVTRLARIALNVIDLERSARFYREALGFVERPAAKPIDAGHHVLPGGPFRSLFLTLGEQCLELTQFERGSRPYPNASQANDLWFQHFAIVTHDIGAAYLRLSGFGASPITTEGPQTLPAASGGVVAYKFRDPDGHPLELLQFPSPAIVGSRDLALNTGIDHTAFSIRDNDASIAFYHRVLGLALVAAQENSGPTQDRLDGLPQVAVQVTALAAAHKTPHIELLGYKTPRGRPRPSPALVNDVAASRTVFCVDKLSHLRTSLSTHRAHSQALTPELASDSDRIALVSDPDGHLLLFEQA